MFGKILQAFEKRFASVYTDTGARYFLSFISQPTSCFGQRLMFSCTHPVCFQCRSINVRRFSHENLVFNAIWMDRLFQIQTALFCAYWLYCQHLNYSWPTVQLFSNSFTAKSLSVDRVFGRRHETFWRSSKHHFLRTISVVSSFPTNIFYNNWKGYHFFFSTVWPYRICGCSSGIFFFKLQCVFQNS